MITISRIKKDFGGPICRHCISDRYGVKLERKNCRYEKHSDVCPSCGEIRHIVKRLTPAGYLKGIGKKPVPSDGQTGVVPGAADSVQQEDGKEERNGEN